MHFISLLLLRPDHVTLKLLGVGRAHIREVFSFSPVVFLLFLFSLLLFLKSCGGTRIVELLEDLVHFPLSWAPPGGCSCLQRIFRQVLLQRTLSVHYCRLS